MPREGGGLRQGERERQRLLVFFYAVERQSSMLFTDKKDSVFCNLQKYFTQIFQLQDRLHHKTNTMWSSKVPALLLTLVHVKVFWMEALQECLVHVLSGMLLERQRNPGQHYKCSTLTQGIQMTELSTVRHLPNCTSLWRPQILH